MSDEIKEILNKLRSDDYYEKEYQKSVYYERDLKKLEDYITNLQQENQTLQENNQAMQKEMVRVWEKEDYKSRVEKAIEYINKHKIEYIDKHFKDDNVMVEFNEYANPQALLELLQGGKDDNN